MQRKIRALLSTAMTLQQNNRTLTKEYNIQNAGRRVYLDNYGNYQSDDDEIIELFFKNMTIPVFGNDILSCSLDIIATNRHTGTHYESVLWSIPLNEIRFEEDK